MYYILISAAAAVIAACGICVHICAKKNRLENEEAERRFQETLQEIEQTPSYS